MQRLLLLLALLTCTAPATLTAQKQLTLLLTVAKADGTELSELTADDLQITEDGATCRILKIESAERTLKLQLLVDNGAGMRSNHGIVRDDVRAFIQALPDGVEVTLVTTSPRPRVLVRATANRQELLEGAERLTPDTGAGQFTESLMDAAARISRDSPHMPVIVSVATPSGSNDIRDGDIQQMRERLRGSGATVHVLMYADIQNRNRGEPQIALGELLAKETGGRFELMQSINTLPSLLTDIVEKVTAVSGGGKGRQFRVTFERPDGKSGDFGRMQMATPSGLAVLSTAFQ